MSETEKELLAIRKLLKMSPMFGLLGNFFEVLANPDKYDSLFKELHEAHVKLDVVVSAVGPAAEIPGMHARAQEAHVKAERLLIEATVAADTTKSDADAAKKTIITQARAEADAETATTEERLEGLRNQTQAGTDKLTQDTTKAAQVHAAREASMKDREAKVTAAEETLKALQTELAAGENDLQKRLDNLNAAMRKSR